MIPIQFTIDANKKSGALSLAKSAIRLGCKWLILRTDSLSEKDAEKAAKEIKKICREQDVTFVIENDTALVKAIDGDGVYLTAGQNVGQVRQEIGEGFLIGTQASNAEEVIAKKKLSADYICCGPFGKETMTAGQLTLDDFKKLMEELDLQDITTPICAYGDLHLEDLDALMATGVRGITLLPDAHGDEGYQLAILQQYLQN